MARKNTTVSDMREYADDWVDWYEGPRKRTASLFQKSLLMMNQEEPFNLDSYCHLVDSSGEREETRVDAKKMARVLFNSWVWDKEKSKKHEHNLRRLRQEKPFENGKVTFTRVNRKVKL